MAIRGAIPIGHEGVFLHGCYVVGEVEPVRDFDRSTKDTAVQSVDKDTGLPLWQVDVIDADPDARDKTIPEAILPELREHLRRWAEAGQEGHVFTSTRGAILRRSTFQRKWSKATTAAGVPGMHFHDLRHAGATWAAVGGATLKELMEHLGHASARAAIIYQHAAADRGRKIADALSEQARKARSEGNRAREGHEGDQAGEEE